MITFLEFTVAAVIFFVMGCFWAYQHHTILFHSVQDMHQKVRGRVR